MPIQLSSIRVIQWVSAFFFCYLMATHSERWCLVYSNTHTHTFTHTFTCFLLSRLARHECRLFITIHYPDMLLLSSLSSPFNSDAQAMHLMIILITHDFIRWFFLVIQPYTLMQYNWLNISQTFLDICYYFVTESNVW